MPFDDPAAPSVCLVMLAKERPDVVDRALTSCLPLIDAALVSVEPGDTLGSHVAAWCDAHGLPCRVVEWERSASGGENRTRLFSEGAAWADETGCGWLLNVDADDELRVREGWTWPALDSYDSHAFVVADGASRYGVRRLFRATVGYSDGRPGVPWTWRYPLHEVAECAGARHGPILPGVAYVKHLDTTRPREHYARQAAMLRAWLAENGPDPRMTYYLGQALTDAGEHAAAFDAYRDRAAMAEGWPDERFVATLRMGHTAMLAGRDPVAHLLAAAALDPTRAEPLTLLAEWHMKQGAWALAAMFARAARDLFPPIGAMHVEQECYESRPREVLRIVAFQAALAAARGQARPVTQGDP